MLQVLEILGLQKKAIIRKKSVVTSSVLTFEEFHSEAGKSNTGFSSLIDYNLGVTIIIEFEPVIRVFVFVLLPATNSGAS